MPQRTAKVLHAVEEAKSAQEREALVLELLKTLPRSELVDIHRKIGPLLLVDIIGRLPNELSFRILSHLIWTDLLTCSAVSRRWNCLANDPYLWKGICDARGWAWRRPSSMIREFERLRRPAVDDDIQSDDDEGMGSDEGISDDETTTPYDPQADPSRVPEPAELLPDPSPALVQRKRQRHSAPSAILSALPPPLPDYKLLHQTHVRLKERFLECSYEVIVLQDRKWRLDQPRASDGTNGHTATIYCLQLHTLSDGDQVLFTGSKDRTLREWDLARRRVRRVFSGVHSSSILSLCAHGQYLISGGSDCIVALWDLTTGTPLVWRTDHSDSVLSVRFDEKRLVTCSKDRTIRTYTMPSMTPEHTLFGHRAAVNAVALQGDHIISASGDRSVRIWSASTGALLHALENHHTRGIAAIDVALPYILTGSSDKHLRFLDVVAAQGWMSAPPEVVNDVLPSPIAAPAGARIPCAPEAATGISLLETLTKCGQCGAERPVRTSSAMGNHDGRPRSRNNAVAHTDLVRSVRLGDDFAVSAGYDWSIKVWDRRTGDVVADLTGGHTGRVFAVDFDTTKIVSCGEDQKICIWDFSHGIDTSFVTL